LLGAPPAPGNPERSRHCMHARRWLAKLVVWSASAGVRTTSYSESRARVLLASCSI
jgi:hypothetical protein